MDLVVINTDWRLETARGKTYGMCFVRVSEPYSHLNFKRGFSLPNPTHTRCALFSLVLGLEMVDAVPVPKEQAASTHFAVSTKNSWVHDTLTSGRVGQWADKNSWPKHVTTNSLKNLLLRAHELIKELPKGAEVVYIKRDDDDPSTVDLADTDESVDADAIANRGGGPEEIEKALREMRMKGVMINELLQSGAKCSRAKPIGAVKKKKMEDKKKVIVKSKDNVPNPGGDKRGADAHQGRGGGSEDQGGQPDGGERAAQDGAGENSS